MRAPFQILAIPYRKKREYQFCILHRADIDQYQFVAGGGENNENTFEAAIREVKEETGVIIGDILQLTSLAYIPANVISERNGKLWSKDTFVIPEYAFGFKCDTEIFLSD